MLRIILSIVTEWGWTQWIFLHFMVSGTCCLVTVHQPPVLTTALGHDVMMPCQLNLSYDEKMMVSPVLYWVYVTEDSGNTRVWSPSEKYEDRVDLLDDDPDSSNKSILLKNVQWADSGKYLCKLSVTTQRDNRFRRKGNETLLMVYDTMIFNLSSHNDSLLWCEVNVTSDPGFVLSIFRDGLQPQTVGSASGDDVTSLPYVTLSESVSLESEGTYECQLHLNKDLITTSIFHYRPPASPPMVKDGLAGKCGVVENIFPVVSDLDVVESTEPWFLYVSLLMVPFIILLGILIALLICSRSVS